MRNAMQFKSIIKNIAKRNGISSQLVLQNYMLERLLSRISLSKYNQNFIIKGGFLIAAIVGLNIRTTMDLDVTIKNKPINEENIKSMFTDIISISVDDDIIFELKSIKNILENKEYSGYRVALTGNFPPMVVPLKVDITTGDEITPKEIKFEYKTLIGDKSIPVLAYNLETILAEKLETIISRGDQTTRPRDYYDIYILKKLQYANIDLKNLKKALSITSSKRGTLEIMGLYPEIMKSCISSYTMNAHWKKYQKSFDYAKSISFADACKVVVEIMNELHWQTP